MSANVMRIVAHGKPVPQGGVRSLGTGRPSIHSNATRLLPWRDTIILATQAAMLEVGWERANGPVSVHGSYFFDRPKAHYTPSGALRDNAPYWPITRANGDLDHLERAVGDALTAAGAICDDSQIVAWNVQKQFVSQGIGRMPHPGAILELFGLKR